MLVVSDLEEVFLPRPAEDLLVNMSESREVIETLLQRLPEMFRSTQNTNNALGPALLAAQKLVVLTKNYQTTTTTTTKRILRTEPKNKIK
jgi:protein transport protein SEC24